MTAALDPEALLVALVLSPATYSRNRFFDLHKDPGVRRIRRRASLIRSIIRHVTSTDPLQRAENVEIGIEDTGGAQLSYVVTSMGMRRTAMLDPIELSLIRFAMSRRGQDPLLHPLPPEDPDRMHIESVLQRLAPVPFRKGLRA